MGVMELRVIEYEDDEFKTIEAINDTMYSSVALKWSNDNFENYSYIECDCNTHYGVDVVVNTTDINVYKDEENDVEFVKFIPVYCINVTDYSGQELSLQTKLEFDITNLENPNDLITNKAVLDDVLLKMYDVLKEDVIYTDYEHFNYVIKDVFAVDLELKKYLKDIEEKFANSFEDKNVEVKLNNIRNVILADKLNIHLEHLNFLKNESAYDKLLTFRNNVNVNYVEGKNVYTKEDITLSLNDKNEMNVSYTDTKNSNNFELSASKDSTYLLYKDLSKDNEFVKISVVTNEVSLIGLDKVDMKGFNEKLDDFYLNASHMAKLVSSKQVYSTFDNLFKESKKSLDEIVKEEDKSLSFEKEI